MGKVNAAMCAQIMIDQFSVDRIINTGIAGGVAHGLSVGDFIVGVASVQHDFDLSPLGYVRGYMAGEDRNAPTFYPSDATLVADLKKAAKEVLPANKVKEGVIATGDVFVSTAGLKEELLTLFGAAAAEMEGAAIAQVSRANGIAAVIIRTVSDLADEKAESSVKNFEQFAADTSASMLLHMLKNAAQNKHNIKKND
jgi:adenosylhomocysteine nucleosidase